MPMTPDELRNINAPFTAAQRLQGMHDARLRKAVPGYANLSVKVEGAPGPGTSNVQTELQRIETGGDAELTAAQAAIDAQYHKDKYGKLKKIPVKFVEDRPKSDAPSTLLPRPPVKATGHFLADVGRSVKHGTKNVYHHGNYEVPPTSAMALLAGAYGMPTLFRMAANNAPAPDFAAIAKAIDEKPFFDGNCLRSAVEYAAAELAAVRPPNELTHAGELVENAFATHVLPIAAKCTVHARASVRAAAGLVDRSNLHAQLLITFSVRRCWPRPPSVVATW